MVVVVTVNVAGNPVRCSPVESVGFPIAVCSAVPAAALLTPYSVFAIDCHVALAGTK